MAGEVEERRRSARRDAERAVLEQCPQPLGAL